LKDPTSTGTRRQEDIKEFEPEDQKKKSRTTFHIYIYKTWFVNGIKMKKHLTKK
jgi:hypothetical protein